MNTRLIQNSLILLPAQILPFGLSASLIPLSLIFMVNFASLKFSLSRLSFYFLFFVILIFSFLYARYNGYAGTEAYYKIFFAVTLFFLLGNLDLKLYKEILSPVTLLALFFCVTIPLIFYYLGYDFATSKAGRFVGFTDHPGNAQIYSIFLFSFLLLNLKSLDRSRTFLVYLILAILIMHIFFSGGRKAILALAVIILIHLVSAKRYAALTILFILPIVLMPLVISNFEALQEAFPSVRILNILINGSFFEDGGRSNQYAVVYENLSDLIFFGKGYGYYSLLYGIEIHNTLLAILFSFGLLPGALFFLCILKMTFLPEKTTMTYFFYILIPLMVLAFFANYIRNDIFWLALTIFYLQANTDRKKFKNDKGNFITS